MSENKVQVLNKRGELVDCDNGIVQDGFGVRVPFFLMDSVQRAVAADADLQVTDAWGAPAGHRPGYVYPARPTRVTEARDASYDAHVQRLNDAWRSPSVNAPPPASEGLDYEAYKDWLSNAWKTTG